MLFWIADLFPVSISLTVPRAMIIGSNKLFFSILSAFLQKVVSFRMGKNEPI
ncbi:hypothetical protein NIASO_05720 [Niabella soli DSM 19437]|uniref:Uncharacterized protein n=1 Tax=Niabella soli DSM 19437 TaxID=929713 RepID=W0F789_9BACT|nr:hypothetical protein NIASO_05720 [Niabella soli DSM 19437]